MKRLVFVLLTLLLAACHQERLSYDGHTFKARGVTGDPPADGWDSILAVYAGEVQGAPPMIGTYALKGKTLVFLPAFDPSPGVNLRMVFHPPGEPIQTLFIPAKPVKGNAAPTSIVEVWPTTQQWPANQLKFYIDFSAPMTKGAAWSHIHLLDEQGQAIDKPFVEIDQELWDPNAKRLTVLFDPGRIKRGLTDNMKEGPPLVPGRRYTLKIDKSWADANGQPLTADFEKPLQAVEDVRLPVDPKLWKITAPVTPKSSVLVDFPRPMDHALALRVITVPGVEGEARLTERETRWVFTPKKPWPKGRHEIRVGGILEDLAGNRLERLFDVDVTDPAQTVPPPASESVWFESP